MLIQSELTIEEKETATPTCPSCGDTQALSRSLTGQTVYLQCGTCRHSWSIAERRRATRAEDYRKRF